MQFNFFFLKKKKSRWRLYLVGRELKHQIERDWFISIKLRETGLFYATHWAQNSSTKQVRTVQNVISFFFSFKENDMLINYSMDVFWLHHTSNLLFIF